MKLLVLYLVSFIVLLAIISCDAKRKRKYCHSSEVRKQCGSNTILVTSRVNGSGIPYTKTFLSDFCTIGPVLDCSRKLGKKCLTPIQREVMEELTLKPALESVSDFCDPNGKVNNRFLKYAPCLHHVVKLSPSYRHECVMAMHAAGEYQHERYSTNLTQSLQALCCAYNRWEDCIAKYLTAWCGEGAPQGIIDLILTVSGYSMPIICPYKKYDPTSEFCKQLLPPLFTPVKGYKSNSLLSWAFSYACPNVGYGFIDESDRHNWQVVQAYDSSKYDLVPDPQIRYTPIYD